MISKMSLTFRSGVCFSEFYKITFRSFVEFGFGPPATPRNKRINQGLTLKPRHSVLSFSVDKNYHSLSPVS